MSGRPSCTKLKGRNNLAQGHNRVALVRLKLATPQSRVKRPLDSARACVHASVRACERACVRACVRVCVCVCVKQPSRPEFDIGYFQRGGWRQ